MKRPAVLAALLLLAAAPALAAHDLFLKLTSYFVTPGHDPVRVPVLNGTFARSENAVTRDRVRDATLAGFGGVNHLGTSGWSVSGDTSYLTFPVRQAGTYVVGASTWPRTLALSAQEFNDYLREDGILDVLEARTRRGELARPARERYAKHVKAIFQAGELRTSSYGAVLGYLAEIVPLANPYTMRVGDSLAVRCLVRGKPVANQVVIAGGERVVEGAEGGASVAAGPVVVRGAGTRRAQRAPSAERPRAEQVATGMEETLSADSVAGLAIADSSRVASQVAARVAAQTEPTPAEAAPAEASPPPVQRTRPIPQQIVRTDRDGVARIRLAEPGKWYVKFVNMVPVTGDPTLDYESQWATLTFEVR